MLLRKNKSFSSIGAQLNHCLPSDTELPTCAAFSFALSAASLVACLAFFIAGKRRSLLRITRSRYKPFSVPSLTCWAPSPSLSFAALPASTTLSFICFGLFFSSSPTRRKRKKIHGSKNDQFTYLCPPHPLLLWQHSFQPRWHRSHLESKQSCISLISEPHTILESIFSVCFRSFHGVHHWNRVTRASKWAWAVVCRLLFCSADCRLFTGRNVNDWYGCIYLALSTNLFPVDLVWPCSKLVWYCCPLEE